MNYIDCGQDSFFFFFFMYIDSKYYFADDLFIKNKIKVKYLEDFTYITDPRYKIMLVKVKDSKSYLFVKSMEELKDIMIDRGYDDYEDVCGKVLDNDMKKRVKKCID